MKKGQSPPGWSPVALEFVPSVSLSCSVSGYSVSLSFCLSVSPLLFLSKSSLFRMKLFRVHPGLGFFHCFPNKR